MMKIFPKFTLLILLFSLFFECSYGQYSDTIVINQNNVSTKVLKEGTSVYLVYFKMKKDSIRTMTHFWTRTITRESYNGTDAIMVSQSWEDKDSIVHTTKSICDSKTFAPLYQYSWWKRAGKITSSSFDFVNKTATVDEKPLTEADTAKSRKIAWQAFVKAYNQYTLNWHLDLEVFPILPYKTYKKGQVFSIPFYDPGFSAPKQVIYTIIGENKLVGYDNQKIDCWLLEHTDKGNKEIFWISKKTKEVLKLEQQINGTMYRYKIKLGFNM
jgi:hypothetical protein